VHNSAGAIVIFMASASIGEVLSVPRRGAEDKSIV
jgi:hypothetical protein